ncbi:MAG: MogA/MoaB family molybdenum cofactor biosynthesis protein [Clostridia bacterium]|nr:MogA/MoaB family molybdenum cofactor biosynthesis protein [Clostridia bacterium]
MRKFAVIVASDTCYSGENEDKSGEKIAEIMSGAGYELYEKVILPDEKDMLADKMREYSEKNIPLVLTTGGTGFSERDVTPEATKAVIDKETLGIAEAIRLKSLEKTDKAMLSRATAGIAKKTLIINLPGSVKAVTESLEVILGAVGHGLDIMLGEASNCGRK